MSDLVPFDGGHMPAAFAGRRSLNEAARAGISQGFAVVKFKGRVWSVQYQRENKPMLDPNTRAPRPFVDVVIVGVTAGLSKMYYEHGYVEGNTNPPDCSAVDGIRPDTNALRPQSKLCATCRHNTWVTREDGKKGKECADSKRIVIVPLGDIENEAFGGPMLLNIPAASLRNFSTYVSMLDRKGAPVEAVATRIGFDYSVAYPKLEFTPVGWLGDDEAQRVIEVMADPQIAHILRVSEHEAEAEAEEVKAEPDALAGGRPAQAFAANPALAAPKPAPWETDNPLQDGRQGSPPAPAPAPAPAAASPTRRVPKPVAAPEVELAAPIQMAPAEMQAKIDALLDL